MKIKKHTVFILSKIILGFQYLFRKRQLLNRKMKDKYSPRMIGLSAAIIVGFLWVIAIFTPPYLGVADDGTFYKVMEQSGLSYIQEDTADIYNNYYIRIYKLDNVKSVSGIGNSQEIFIKSAIFLDRIFTKDGYFDIRFLAALYGIFFLPAVYSLVKQACIRVSNFSEAIVILVFGVLIFGDITYLTYSASLYPEALWLICLLYTAVIICSLRKGNSFLKLFSLMLVGIPFSLSRQQCGIIGILIAGFFLRAIFLDKGLAWKLNCILYALILSISGFISLYKLEPDFSITSKYHSMTRGVLFQAENPEKALEEFGINSSYSVLANTSAYDYYPLVTSDTKVLYEGFYDKYSPYDISLYYVKHPGNFIRMMDIAVKGVTNLRRSYCGNYEMSAGMPRMAKSLFWSGWSNFKERSMPKTIGYLILLLIISFVFYGRGTQPGSNRNPLKDSQLMAETVIITAGIGITQAVITIIMSGDAEITQHGFLLGAALDVILYFTAADLLSKLDILQEREGK